jgi:hypothetical protein
MAIRMNTLRPGLLVSLNTSVRWQCRLQQRGDRSRSPHGGRQAASEVAHGARHQRPGGTRKRNQGAFEGALARPQRLHSFGLRTALSGDRRRDLQKAIAEARKLTDQFNATATLTHVSFYVMIGRIAPDDVEAVKAINSEVRELMETMESGLKNLDAKTVRDAANRARNIGAMLTGDAAARVRNAIDVARIRRPQDRQGRRGRRGGDRPPSHPPH